MRKILCIILILSICTFSIITYAENLEDLKTQYEEKQNQINDANSELEGVQSDLSQNLQQVQKIDETINTTQEELDKLNNEIQEMNDSIEQISTQLNTAEEKYNKQKQMLEARLIAMQEAGKTEYLDVILSSKSISNFISNYFLLTELAEYDTELLENVENIKKDIETSKQKLEYQKEQLTAKKQTQLKTSKVLQNAKVIRQSFVEKLSEEEIQIQQKIEQYNQEFKAIEAEILQLSIQSANGEYIGGIMAWPVPGYTRISSPFGMRTHPITGVYKLHTGIDIAGAPIGTNFLAAADGTVVKAQYNTAYGNMVIIDHGGGIQTLYAHGVEIVAQLGQTVKQGDVVLKVGSTGYSTGPHAHFEVRVNGQPVDPMPYFTSSGNNETQDNTNE